MALRYIVYEKKRKWCYNDAVDFSIAIQMQGEFHIIVIPILAIIRQCIFAHANYIWVINFQSLGIIFDNICTSAYHHRIGYMDT